MSVWSSSRRGRVFAALTRPSRLLGTEATRGTRRVDARWRRTAWLAMTVALVASPAACRDPRQASGSEQELVIFAAASLRDVFEELASTLEEAHPGVDVKLSTAGSQALRAQIEHGAPADVFASASVDHIDALEDARLLARRTVFARTDLVIVTPRDNPSDIRAVTDLPRARRLVIGAKTVPIGAYTRTLLERIAAKHGSTYAADVERRVVSEELDVRQIVAKVELGEADAGIVYASDARAFGDRLHVVEIPADLQIVAEYHQAILAAAPHPTLARAWLDLVASAEGDAILQKHGFHPARSTERREP